MALVVSDQVEKTVKEHLVDQVEFLDPTFHLPDLDRYMVDLAAPEKGQAVVPDECFTGSDEECSISEGRTALQDLLC